MNLTARRHLVSATLLAVGMLTALTQLPAHAAVSTVYVGSFYFSTVSGGPDNTALTIENGDQLRFVAQDSGHTVEVPELGISQALSRGQTFTTPALTKAGTFTLYCSPHRNRGHQTSLTIRAAAAAEPAPAPAPTAEPKPEPKPTASSGGGTSGGGTSTGGTTTGGTTAGGSSGGGTSSTTAASGTAKATSAARAVASKGTAAPATTTAAPTAQASTAATSDATASGLGTADEDEIAVPATAGSLEDLIGRPPAADGSWTRSVWMALVLLLPMLALAALALTRRERPVSDEEPRSR